MNNHINFENISDEEFELVLKERFKAYEREYDAVKKVLEKMEQREDKSLNENK